MSGVPVIYGDNISATAASTTPPFNKTMTVDGLAITDGGAGAIRQNYGFQSDTSSAVYRLIRYTDPSTQTFTGATNQNVVLPHSTLLSNGYKLTIYNNGSGTVTIFSNRPVNCYTTPTSIVLPSATITVSSTSGFSASGTLYVLSGAGVQTVTYTGVTATTFTGCSGGTGTIAQYTSVDQPVTTLLQLVFGSLLTYSEHTCIDTTGVSGVNGWSTLVFGTPVMDSSLLFTTNTPYPSNMNKGMWYGLNSFSGAFNSSTITFGQNARTGGIDQIAIGTSADTSGARTTIAVASNGVALPTSTINVASTLGFMTGATTTVTVGVTLPVATITVASTALFPTPSGTILVTSGLGVQTVTYTGVTATTFTGCSGGAGIVSIGAAVTMNTSIQITLAGGAVTTVTYASITSTTFVGCAGGSGTLTTADAVYQPTTNTRHIAIGPGAIVTGNSPAQDYMGIAIGPNARSYGDDRAGSISIGTNANTYSNTTINSGLGGNVAIGNNSFAGTRSVAIGSGVSGPGSGAYADIFSVAVGYGSTADLLSATYGTQAYAFNQSAACGFQASAIDFATSIGPFSSSLTGGTSIGAYAQSNNYGVAIGPYARANILESVCMGGSTTLIVAASNGVVLPANTINVLSTQSFHNSGTLVVYNSTGASQTITYTGPNTATAFVGCSGGTGSLATGGIVAQYNEPTDDAHAWSLVFNRQSTQTNSFTFNSRFVETYSALVGFSAVDNRVVCWQDSPRSHFFTSTTSNQVCLLPPATTLNQNGFYTNIDVTGTTSTAVYTSINTNLISAGSPSAPYSITLPTSTLIVASVAGFNASGTVYIRASAGNAQLVSYSGVTNATTTIAVASNGVSLPSATSIEVASTTGFSASGSIVVTTSNGTYIVSYTGPNTATTFVGCTTTGTAGTMSTGGAITQIQFTGCTGGTGTIVYNGKTGEGIVAQSSSLISYVYPGQSVRFSCVDITGSLGAAGWISTLADSVVTQAMSATVAPSNYTSSSFGSAVADLYRSANNAITTSNVSTTIASPVTYPQATIDVATTDNFTYAGAFLVQTSIGLQKVTYTGVFGNAPYTFTGCTGPVAGTSAVSNTVRQSGFIPVTSSVSGTTLTVDVIGDAVIERGMFLTGGGVLPDTQIVALGTGSGGTGTYIVDLSQSTSVTTTIGAASDTLSLPQSVINVASTAGFFAEGSVLVTTSLGPQLVRYTGPNTATTIVGCTGGTGVMSTGGNVSLIIAPTNVVFNFAQGDKLYARSA